MGPDQGQDKPPAGSTPPDNAGGDKPPVQPTPPVFGGSDDGNKKKKMLVLGILILLILGFLGWWFFLRDDAEPANTSNNSSQQEESTEETATCEDGQTAYENDSLDLGFCYPTEWGTVTVTDGKFAAADTGSRWIVGFSDKDMVHLGVVSEDWSTAVARDGTCVDPAVQVLPAFSPFSTTWATEGTPVTNATRGIEVSADAYLIQETVDDLLTNGVCLEGYTIISGTYDHSAASYSADFAAPVSTPQQHIDSPNTLISEADRNDFYAFVKSVHQLP